MMTPLFSEPELRNLLQQDEGQFLEFKSLWDPSGDTRRVLDRRIVRDFIAECVAAFANADGATLLLGVDDDETPSADGYPEEAIAEFLAVPERRLRPAVPIRHQRCRIDGNEVIMIQVRMEPEAVMVDGDGFPYRVGDRTLLEPQEVINQRKQAYRTVGYEQRTRPEATLDDLDLELAKAFLSKTVYRDRSMQEAIVNAFAHRDYNDQGREIEVWFFEDRMEVVSPGELVTPVTLEQLRRRRSSHASRNPLLVRVLVEVAIMREEGEGIPSWRSACRCSKSSSKPITD